MELKVRFWLQVAPGPHLKLNVGKAKAFALDYWQKTDQVITIKNLQHGKTIGKCSRKVVKKDLTNKVFLQRNLWKSYLGSKTISNNFN